MNLSLVLLYIHLGLIPDLCFIANILLQYGNHIMHPFIKRFRIIIGSYLV